MVDISMGMDEERLLWLEAENNRLRRIVDATSRIARHAKQDASRPPPVATRTLYWAQADGAITAQMYGVAGTGNAYLCKLIGTTYYRVWRSDAMQHHVIAPVVNGAGIGFGDATLLLIEQVDGQWSIIWADCSTSAPAAFPDEPH